MNYDDYYNDDDDSNYGCKLENNLQGLVLSLNHVGPKERTQVVRLMGQEPLLKILIKKINTVYYISMQKQSSFHITEMYVIFNTEFLS